MKTKIETGELFTVTGRKVRKMMMKRVRRQSIMEVIMEEIIIE